MSVIEEKVGRGANFLDEKVPGWATKVDPAKIDMSSNFTCVMGQLASAAEAGDAWHYSEQFGLTWAEYDELGFIFDSTDEQSQAAAWRAEIRKRTTPATT